MIPDGRVADWGEIIGIDPSRRLVVTWCNEFEPEVRQEGYSRLTYMLERQGDMIKLTLAHNISSLKSLLKTGKSLEATRR